jgi:signal transduction histidine kinase
LIAGAALCFAVLVFATWLATSVPWIGVDFRVPGSRDNTALIVAQVHADSPAAGKLQPGDIIDAVIDAQGQRIPVDASLMIEDPFALPTWSAFDEHLRTSGAVQRALAGGEVELELHSGARPRLKADARVPLRGLRPGFWLILAVTIMAYSICLGVWVYRPRDGAAQALATSGAFVLLAFACVTVINYRPWGLPEPLYHSLLQTNLVTIDFAAFAFLAVFWYYPAPLNRFPFLTVALCAATLVSIAGIARMAPYPGQSVLPSVLAYTLGVVPLGVVQWRRTRNNLLERAALKWLYLVAAVCIGWIVLTTNLPIALGLPLLVSSTVVMFGAAALFGGIALGILRYRLFNLDRWWFEAWMWGIGGVLVIALDALLLWFNTSFGVALGAALMLAGWVWFPLRQWLWHRLSPAAGQTVERHLPRLIDTLFAARNAVELSERWHGLLRDIYAPLELRALAESIDTPTISEDGLGLRVPGLNAGECLDLHYGHKGQRLFSAADEQLASSLYRLARQAVQARRAQDQHEAEQQAQQREKELLVQDLHDGLGGAVTNISLLAEMGCKQEDVGAAHRAFAAIAGLARESASEIRGFMYAIEDTDADWQDIAADLRVCARGVLEPHGIEQDFTVTLDERAPPPDIMLRMNLFRAFKETLGNVVKHAHARRVGIRLQLDPDRVALTVHDDGAGFLLEQRGQGASGKTRGLRHLHERAQALGGKLTLRSTPGAGTTVTLTAPLPVKSPLPGIASGSPPA